MTALDADAAWERLVAQPAAVLATIRPDHQVDLVPFVFAALPSPARRQLVSAVDHKPKRHTNLQRLDNIRHTPAVTILADYYSDDWSTLWWVRARGRAAVIEPDSGPAWTTAIDALAASYHQYRTTRPHGAVIAIEVDEVTGWHA